jgi:hypothetical protein
MPDRRCSEGRPEHRLQTQGMGESLITQLFPPLW